LWFQHFICGFVLKEITINCFNLVFFVQFFKKITFVGNIQNKVHPFFSSIKIIHPWTCGRIFFHKNENFVLHVNEYSPNILSKWIKYFKNICSCSCVHARLLMLMLAGLWTNIPTTLLPILFLIFLNTSFKTIMNYISSWT
jgi:hypothetical protein